MGGKKKAVRRKRKSTRRGGGTKKKGRRSPAVKTYAKELTLLIQCPSKTRKAMIAGGSSGLVKALCECALNILKGHVPLTMKQKRSLKRRKKDLRSLASRKTSLKKKKKILQKGGFLGPLLAPLIGGLVGIVGKKILD